VISQRVLTIAAWCAAVSAATAWAQGGTFHARADVVQFDAVVLDPRGLPVRDLGASDFAVFQDGQRVPVRDVTFVRGPSTARRPPSGEQWNPATTVVFLIDDMAMTLPAFQRTVHGLGTTIEGGALDGFDVGILRTGETGYRTTRTTADRQSLLRRVKALRYLARSHRRGAASGSGADGPAGATLERTFVEGTLGSVNSLLANLRAVEGRKIVVLLSEGIALDVTERQGGEPLEARLDRLAHLAADGNVVAYSVDVSGLDGGAALMARATLRDGLAGLAERMRGMYLSPQNDIGTALARVFALERSGYYLVSYVPPDGTFVDAPRAPFRRIAVRVKDASFAVRARPGFLGRKRP
jgi:VWFA-related protein